MHKFILHTSLCSYQRFWRGTDGASSIFIWRSAISFLFLSIINICFPPSFTLYFLKYTQTRICFHFYFSVFYLYPGLILSKLLFMHNPTFCFFFYISVIFWIFRVNHPDDIYWTFLPCHFQAVLPSKADLIFFPFLFTVTTNIFLQSRFLTDFLCFIIFRLLFQRFPPFYSKSFFY